MQFTQWSMIIRSVPAVSLLVLASCASNPAGVTPSPITSVPPSPPTVSPTPASASPSAVAAESPGTIQATTAQPVPLSPSDRQQASTALPGKQIIAEQSFRISVAGCTDCLFVAAKDTPRDKPQLSLHWIKLGQGATTLATAQFIPPTWTFVQLNAVSFLDLNVDGSGDDLIVISDYVAGPVGPGTTAPFPVVLVYLNQGGNYALDEKVSDTLTTRGVSSVAEAEEVIRKELKLMP